MNKNEVKEILKNNSTEHLKEILICLQEDHKNCTDYVFQDIIEILSERLTCDDYTNFCDVIFKR